MGARPGRPPEVTLVGVPGAIADIPSVYAWCVSRRRMLPAAASGVRSQSTPSTRSWSRPSVSPPATSAAGMRTAIPDRSAVSKSTIQRAESCSSTSSSTPGPSRSGAGLTSSRSATSPVQARSTSAPSRRPTTSHRRGSATARAATDHSASCPGVARELGRHHAVDLVEVERRQRLDDPYRTGRLDRAAQRRPGRARAIAGIGRGEPGAPVGLAGRPLVGGQLRLVAVQVDLVREDPHPQLVADEPRLEPHRQQRHRHVAGETGDAGLELGRGRAHGTTSSGTPPAWMATRIGCWWVRAARWAEWSTNRTSSRLVPSRGLPAIRRYAPGAVPVWSQVAFDQESIARWRAGAVQLVEPEPRLGRLLLDDEEPAVAAEQLGRAEVEPHDADVRPEHPGEHRSPQVLRHARVRGEDPADRAPGIQAGVGVPPQQLAADEQGDLAVGVAGTVLAEAAGPRPGVDGDDVVAAAAVPEPAERGAALVGREGAPEQLAAQLVVDADEQGLDEPGVRLEHRDRVDGDLADARAGTGRDRSAQGRGRAARPAVGATMTRSRFGARATPSGASTSGPVDAWASCPETPTVTMAASRRGTDCAGSVAAISDWPTVPMPSDWKSGGGAADDDLGVGDVVHRDREPLHRGRVGDPLGRGDEAQEVVDAVPGRVDLLPQVAGLLEVPLAEDAGHEVGAPGDPRVRVGRDGRRVVAHLRDQGGRHGHRHPDAGEVDGVGVGVEHHRRHRGDAHQAVGDEVGRVDRQVAGGGGEPGDHPDPRRHGRRPAGVASGDGGAQHRTLRAGQPAQGRVGGGVGQARAGDRGRDGGRAPPGPAVHRGGQLQQAVLGQRGEVPGVQAGQRLQGQPGPAEQLVGVEDLLRPAPSTTGRSPPGSAGPARRRARPRPSTSGRG